MIRSGYQDLMGDFAAWFIEAVAEEGEDAEDFRAELRQSYATAFEFIVIGAAHLEGANACRGTRCRAKLAQRSLPGSGARPTPSVAATTC